MGRFAVVRVLLILVLAGCSSSTQEVVGSRAPGAQVPGAEVVAVASQSRDDQVLGGRMTITVTNAGSLPFTVATIRLDSPAFTPVAASVRDDRFRPGLTYALPVGYGPARCDADPSQASAVIEVYRDGERPRELRVPLASPDGLLARNHREECVRAALDRQVGVRVIDLRPAGAELRGVLRLERRTAAGAISLVELRGTALFALAADLPARLEAEQPSLDVPLAIAVASCSGHVIGEVKQPYAFSAFLAIGAAPPRHAGTTTGPADRQQMQDLVRRVCPEAGSTGTVGS